MWDVVKTIEINDREIYCEKEESVLDALLRENIDIPYSCKAGICHSCKVQSLNEPPPKSSQNGLKDVLQHQGYFLACLCYPEQNMIIDLNSHKKSFSEALVIDKKLLSPNTLLLTLRCAGAFSYFAGQFVNLKKPDGLQRSYSIASNHLTHPNTLSFHIRILKGGLFSEWAHQVLAIGDTLEISKPHGECCYLPSQLDQNLLLIATGTGLAPLMGIIDEALFQGHTGGIHLFHGSRDIDGLYLIEELKRLAQQHHNFYYIPCLSGPTSLPQVIKGRVQEVALARWEI